MSLLIMCFHPGFLTLGEVRAALRSAHADWFDLGIMLDLPFETLEVIEGHAVSSTLYGFINN